MIEIKYKSSNGNEHNLVGDRMRVTDGNFHKYAWKRKAKETDCGDVLEGFAKESVTYKITLNFRGSLEERKQRIDNIRDDFEHDILTKTAGTITFGKFSIKGFIIESDTRVSEIKSNWSKDEILIYCPYPMWVKENSYIFHSYEISSLDNKNYPGKYPYRYANGMSSNYIINPHFTDTNFKLIIYGPVINPQVIIGGTPYLVNIVLEEGERLEIDSRNETVIKIMQEGTQISVFHNRQKGRYFFTKIPPGRQSIVWTGKFDFDLIVYEERSEPKWNV